MITKIKIIIIAIGCLFGISLFFINSSIMTNFLGSFLHVDYSYTGGIVAGDFVDFIGDDDIGIVRYAVHKPVTNARWQKSADYWQLDLEAKDASAYEKTIKIFICFDKNHPWNFSVWINGGKGTVYNSNGELLCNTEMSFMNDGKLLKLRIPLHNKELLKILGAEKSWHYIVTGTDLQFDRDDFPPLEVKMKGVLNQKGNKKETKAYIQKVKDIYAQSGGSSDIFGDLDSNLALYKSKIEENPDDYVSLAYYGSLLASKGGQSNVMKAVALVNEAYTYLDKAAQLAAGKEEEIEVLMNRASVSAAVPEQVFGKAQSGATDFIKIISLTKEPNLKAYCYVMAYECYTKCGKDTQALLALQEAKKMIK